MADILKPMITYLSSWMIIQILIIKQLIYSKKYGKKKKYIPMYKTVLPIFAIYFENENYSNYKIYKKKNGMKDEKSALNLCIIIPKYLV